MTYKFTSAITRGGSILRPDVIEIDQNNVTYKKRNSYLINSDTLSMPLKQVSSVKIDTSIIGTKIIISGTGRSSIVAEKFSKSDAHEIKRTIERFQNSYEQPTSWKGEESQAYNNEKVKGQASNSPFKSDIIQINLSDYIESDSRKHATYESNSKDLDSTKEKPVFKDPLKFQRELIEHNANIRELKLKDLELIKANPHTKWLYWPKLIWNIYLDSTWKKILFFLALWVIVAQISSLFNS